MFQMKIDKESDKIIKITLAEKRPLALRKPSTQTGVKSCVLHTFWGGGSVGGQISGGCYCLFWQMSGLKWHKVKEILTKLCLL